jgi:hypothetical protein
MSMSTWVTGLRDANDPKHVKMVAAMKACLAAGLEFPKELDIYFDGTANPDRALEIEIKSTEGKREMEKYIDVVVSDIPPGVKVIRFTNSW